MRDETAINSLPEHVTVQDARALIERETGRSTGDAPQQVSYPYHWFRAQPSVPRLFGRRQVDVSCLVDARTGIASTCDTFQPQSRNVDRRVVLSVTNSTATAERAARRCLTHSLAKRLRTIADFRVQPENLGVVFKTYWILSCAGQEIILDSATGAWHLLRAA